MLGRKLLAASAVVVVLAGQAWADDYIPSNPGQVTIQPAASMMAYSAGSDQAQVSIAPNWSDELGFSIRAAAGSYLGDAVALGAIVEYGQTKQEYIANLGFQLSDDLSLIGTVGNLAETKEFIAGESDDKASQMEYGLSLKLAPQEGLGFELNGYAVDAKADNESIETGKIYGTEALASLGLADSTLIKIGGGYEWLEWDGGEKNDDWMFRTEVSQRLTDSLGLQGHAKLGSSERTYGGGLNLSLSNDGTNHLGLNYTYIEGLHGIADDKRIELSWAYGFGAGPAVNTASMDDTDTERKISPAADVVAVAPPNNLLGDVMKRPGYLPERVLARPSGSGTCDSIVITGVGLLYTNYPYIDMDPGIPEFASDKSIVAIRVYINENLSSDYPLTDFSFGDTNSGRLTWTSLSPQFPGNSTLRVEVDTSYGCYVSDTFAIPPP